MVEKNIWQQGENALSVFIIIVFMIFLIIYVWKCKND